MTARIALVELEPQSEEIAREVHEGLARIVARSAFLLGEEVARFERAFARFCGVEHAVGLANGTDAIELSLRALGVGPGDEVIVPAFTFVATAIAVTRCGATPVFADCDEQTLLLDPLAAQQVRTGRTRAIVPVHLYGQCAPVERLRGLGVPIVEDAAQAHGARRHGVTAGALGDAGAFSFHPSKNLGAWGDAGAAITRDAAVASRLRALRTFGSELKNEHPIEGVNSRLDAVQAVVLGAKLERLERWNEARRAAARRYDALLAQAPGVRLPQTLEGNEHVFHLYVVRVAERDRVLGELGARGVGASVHYPAAVPLLGVFAPLGHGPGDFPVAERAEREVLSLPLHPYLSAEDQGRVAEALAAAML